LILNKDYRRSVDALVANAIQRLPSFLLFVKELAIIRGLTHQQVFEATSTATDNTPFKGSREDGKSVSFTLTQQFPQNRPEWSMGHLMLARSRSDATISIKNTTKAPFRVKGVDRESPETSAEPSHITIGSGVPVRVKTASFRGAMRLDEANQTIRLDFRRLAFDEIGKPVILQFTPTSEGVATCKFSFVPSEMTVGDSSILSKATSLMRNEEFTAKVTIEGKPLSDVTKLDLGQSELSGLEARLLQVNRDCPSPLFTRDEDVKAIVCCEDSQLASVVEGILENVRDTRPTVTTLFLRYATVEGRDYYEEYLGMAPLSFAFNPPTIEGEGISQSDINSQWSDGSTDFKLESSFREETEELANDYREWASDVSQPFPFKCDNDLQFHYCKTRLMMVFHRIIDRRWYKERKVVFIFRPVSKPERYGVEMEYWRSQDDAERTELLNELFQKAAAQEAAQKEKEQSKQEMDKVVGNEASHDDAES